MIADPLTRRPLSVALLTSAAAWRGSGVSFSNIASGLAAAGHHPYLFAGTPAVVEAFGACGFSAMHVPTDNTGVREILALRRALGAVAADVLLVDRPRDLRLGALALLGQPTRLVNRYNLSHARPPFDLLSRWAYQRVQLTIFPSDTLAQRTLAQAPYLRRPPHRVIFNGVDPEQFFPDPAGAAMFRAAHGLTATPFILAVGSLTPEKRYDFLLDALACLGPDAPVLVVCGDGPLADAMRAKAQSLGVDVRWLGLLPPELLPAIYTAAECVVHACAVETFGLSVLEAMACGAPVLAVRGGAVVEVLGEAGVLAPAEDRAAFAKQLRALLADAPWRARLGDEARHRALTCFSLARMHDVYVKTIESVADLPPAR